MIYERPAWFSETDLDERSALQRYFDSIEELDALSGYQERNTGWFEANILPDFLRVKDRLRLGPTLLDVGCGFGYFTRRFARHFSYVVGVDFSPARVAGAKEYNSAKNIDYLALDLTNQRLERFEGRLVAGSGQGTPFRLHSAVSSAVVQHVPPSRRKDAFATIGSALEPGGSLILYDERTDERAREWDGFYEAISLEWIRNDLDMWSLSSCEFIAQGMNGEKIHRFELRSK